jgi:hypothetical protein
MDSKLAAVGRHLARPLRGGAACVVVVFAILLGACSTSLLGLPLEMILLSWFFKYAFILFDSTLRGFDEPPVLDINMMNPYGDLRPIVMLLIIAAMVGITWETSTYAGPTVGGMLGLGLLLLLPASMASLGLENNVLHAVSPFAWSQIIYGLGAYYWLTIGLIAVEFAALYVLGKLPLGLIFQFAAGMFGTLSAFSLLAGALYERRDQLGLVTWASPERREEKQRQEDHRRDEKVITEAYGLVRTARHQDSWQML